MKLSIQVGATSQTVNLFIQDSSSTTGAGLAGLAFGSAGLTAYYALPRAAAVSITLATLAAVTSAYSSGGFKEIDATNMPGWYRFDIPDAALASGRFVDIHLKGATNMAPLPLEIELTAWNNQDAVRGGMTALPNAAAEAAGGLYTRGTGAGQIAQQANGQADVNLSTIKTQAVTCAAGVTVLASVGTAATSTAQTGDAYARLGAPAGASVSADVAAVKVDTAAVKIQTDKLTFTVANQIDANVLDWKGATAPAMTGDAFARLGVPAGASVSADLAVVAGYIDTEVAAILAAVDTEVAAIKAKTDSLPAAPSAVADIPTAAQNAAALLDLSAGVETGLTPRQALRLMVAALAGKLSGAATTTVVIRNAVADSKDRITATVDADGNRSAVTLDLT
jgi:hypothetical protein